MNGGPFIERIGLPHTKLTKNEPPNMYSTTGFSRDGVVDLCAMIHAETMDDRQPWPPILGLFRSVTVALTYMRRTRVQAELAATFGVSQPPVSRAITRGTPL